jgi:hypothetical protein
MELPPHYPRYGQCDSYFTESDDGIYANRAEARERARALGRIRQRALAEELSRATAEEYQEDILEHMEFMEVRFADGSTVPQLLTTCRLELYLMSARSTFRPKSSGS